MKIVNNSSFVLFCLLLACFINMACDCNNVSKDLSNEDIVNISISDRYDLLLKEIENNPDLSYRKKLLISMKLFSLKINPETEGLLEKHFPKNREEAETYWSLDRMIWSEESIDTIWAQNDFKKEYVDYFRLEKFFELANDRPNILSMLFQFTIYSSNISDVEDFSDLYIEFFSQRPLLFIDSLKKEKYEVRGYIKNLIEDVGDYEKLEEVKNGLSNKLVEEYNNLSKM